MTGNEIAAELVNMGLPLAQIGSVKCNSPQYLGDLFSWSAIRIVQRNRKLTVKWPPGFPCRLVLKTAPTAVWQQQLTLCAPPPSRTVLLAVNQGRGRLRCYKLREIRTGM